MNHNDFLLLLSRAANWHQPQAETDAEHNTVAPVLRGLRADTHECGICGRLCEGGQHIEQRRFTHPEPHCRNKCLTCGLQQNPYTSAWDLTPQRASQIWAVYLRKKPANRTTPPQGQMGPG